MAEGRSIGTVFVELALDPSRYTRAQQQLYKDATQTSLSIEENFKKLNIKTSAEFDLMRAKITNAFESIRHSHQATANDILRAEKAKNDQLARINEEQFGKQTSMLAALRGHWFAASAAIAVAIGTMYKAWNLAKAGADFDEQHGILDNLARKYSTTASEIVAAMERASDGLIAKSDLMQVALAGIAKGLKPEQLTNLADAARILGDAVGKDATTALKELSEALESGRTRALQTYLGTAIDLRDVFGELESKLTAAEKAQALYNITMIEATRLQAQQSGEVDTAADKLERLEAKYKNATTSLAQFMKTVVVGFAELMKMTFTWTAPMEESLLEFGGRLIGDINAPFTPAGGGLSPTAAQGAIDKYQAEINRLRAVVAGRASAAGAGGGREDREPVEDLWPRGGGTEDLWPWPASPDRFQRLRGEGVIDIEWEVERIEEMQQLWDLEAKYEAENLEKRVKANEQAAKDMAEAHKRAADEIRDAMTPVFDSITSGISTTLKGVMLGTQSMSEAFRNMAQNITLSIMDTIIRKAMAALMEAIEEMVIASSRISSASGGGGGGWLGSALSAVGSYFSSTGGGYSGATTMDEGGIVTRPTLAILSKNSQPEAVIPLSKAQGLGQPVQITQVFAPQVGVEEVVRREFFKLMPEFRKQAELAVLAARDRGGRMAAAMGARR